MHEPGPLFPEVITKGNEIARWVAQRGIRNLMTSALSFAETMGLQVRE
jgi:hypothetical protein